MKTLNVYFNKHELINTNWYLTRIYEHLVEAYKDINFNHVTNLPKYSDFSENSRKGGYDLFVVENPENGKYTLINFTDTPHFLFYKGLGWDADKVQQWFATNSVTKENYKHWQKVAPKSIFDGEVYYPDDFLEKKWVPISFHPIGIATEQMAEKNYEQRKSIVKFSDKLIFRGHVGPQDRFEMLVNKDKWLNSNFEIHPDKIDAEEYFKEQLNLLCGWSICGVGDMSCRDIEMFGSGQCMFRTSFSSTFDDQPIAGYHYIKICDSSNFSGSTTTNYKEYVENILKLQQSIYSRYDEFKQIGENGRQWYLKNCTRNSPNNTLQIFKRKFDIGLLF